MLGTGTIIIDKVTWNVSIAADLSDLAAGLGGQASIPAKTGEIFDLGVMQTIEVTTVPMLFPLDIAFLDSNLAVTEVYNNVQPGYLITPQNPARYFLEVNAGELLSAGVKVGDQATGAVTTPPIITSTATTTDWTSMLTAMMPMFMMLMMFAMMAPMLKGVTASARA